MGEKMTLTDAEVKWLLTSPDALRAVADYNDWQESQADSMGMPCSVHRERRIAFHAEAKRIEAEWDAEREPEQRVFFPDAHLTQPAQAVDVDAVRAVIEQTREYYERTDDRRTAYAMENVLSDIYETLTAALTNAQAVDGWQPTDDDVQAWRGRHNISLSLYDCRSAIEDARIMHHFDVRPAALPNANGKEGS